VELSLLVQEQLHVLCLDTQGYLQTSEMIYQGTAMSSRVRPCEVFRPALRHNSVSIILVHNHPSGDPEPSAQDIAVTKHLRRVGRQLGICVLDHLVIGKGRWVSLAELGMHKP